MPITGCSNNDPMQRNKWFILVGFLAMVASQLWMPASMILGREQVLRDGTAFHFKTQPIDPNDPFRGKYVQLSFELDHFDTSDTTWQQDETVYLELTIDSAGFAAVANVWRSAPPHHRYLRTTVSYLGSRDDQPVLYFYLPFDRFYMEENKAQPAETAHQQAATDGATTYALVYVKDGEGVLREVFVGNRTLREVAAEHAASYTE